MLRSEKAFHRKDLLFKSAFVFLSICFSGKDSHKEGQDRGRANSNGFNVAITVVRWQPGRDATFGPVMLLRNRSETRHTSLIHKGALRVLKTNKLSPKTWFPSNQMWSILLDRNWSNAAGSELVKCEQNGGVQQDEIAALLLHVYYNQYIWNNVT